MTKLAHNVPLGVGEVILKLRGASTKSERAAILKNNDSAALRAILRLNFDSSIKFNLPSGVPKDYRRSNRPDGFGDITLKSIYKKFYIFVKESTPLLKQHKREEYFLQLLSQLDNTEAQVLIDAKDKKLDCGLTKKLVKEIFPDLLPHEVAVKAVEENNQHET